MTIMIEQEFKEMDKKLWNRWSQYINEDVIDNYSASKGYDVDGVEVKFTNIFNLQNKFNLKNIFNLKKIRMY